MTDPTQLDLYALPPDIIGTQRLSVVTDEILRKQMETNNRGDTDLCLEKVILQTAYHRLYIRSC